MITYWQHTPYPAGLLEKMKEEHSSDLEEQRQIQVPTNLTILCPSSRGKKDLQASIQGTDKDYIRKTALTQLTMSLNCFWSSPVLGFTKLIPILLFQTSITWAFSNLNFKIYLIFSQNFLKWTVAIPLPSSFSYIYRILGSILTLEKEVLLLEEKKKISTRNLHIMRLHLVYLTNLSIGVK